MNKKIEFENHFAARVLEVFFPEGYAIKSQSDLSYLKAEWSKNLKSWHSPYTCIFDLSHFEIDSDLKEEFEKLINFFKKFFMRKIIGFYSDQSQKVEVSFEVFASYEDALKQTPLANEKRAVKVLGDLRSLIQIDNDFNAHVMEISFSSDVDIQNKDDLAIIKAKIKNILLMWHTPYSILINCVNCTFSDEAKNSFVDTEKFLKSFFCKSIIGYAPKGDKSSYPFTVYRSRHLAAESLENNGLQSGEKAKCTPRK